MLSLEKKIKNFLKENRIQVKEFCDVIGISTANLYLIYKRNSIDTKYLEKIEKKYNIKPSYFLNDETKEESIKKRLENKKGVESESKNGSMLTYERDIEHKDEIITILYELVDYQKEIIKMLKDKK